MKKRFLSIFLTICMLLTLLPTAALATEGDTCTCSEKCTTEAKSNNCPACSVEDADLSTVCKGPVKYNVWIYTTADGDDSDSTSAAGGSVTGAGSYAAGDTVTMTVSFNDGYCAVAWAAADNNIEPFERLYLEGIPTYASTDTTVTFTMPNKDVYITAGFRAHEYAYSYRDNGDGTHTNVCRYCRSENGDAAPHVDAHGGGDETTPPNGYCDDCSAAMIYTISFDANGGTGSMGDVEYTYSESDYTLPANGFTAPENKAFVGWATSPDGSVISGSTYSIMSDTTLYAIWEDHTHSYSSVWLMDASHHWRDCSCGDRKDFAAHTSSGAASYGIPETCTVCGYEIAPAKTTYSLTVNYEIYASDGAIIGSGIESKTIEFAPGTVVDLSDCWPEQMTSIGNNGTTYYFRGFSYNTDGGGNYYNAVTVSENTVMYATWVRQNMVTVEFDTNDGAMSYKRARAGTTYTISDMNLRHIPVRSGYDFVGWSLADDGTADSSDTQITADCTLYAVWQQYLPSYDDDYYDPPPASTPVDVGGDYDAILRDDVVIIRGDAPISGTLDLTGTNAEAIRFTDDAVRESIAEGDISTIVFSEGAAATMTGSAWAAAEDALRSGESLQIAVTKVDAGALPEELTTPPEDNDETFEDDEVLLNWDTLSPTTIFTEEELLDLGVIGADDDDITWEELKYLYHYMTPEEIDFLWSYINSTQAQYADTQLLAWLDEMIERDGVELPFTYDNLLDYADFTDEQIAVLTKPDGVAGSDYPTIGELRKLGLTLEQMQLLQSNAEELREGASAEEQAQYDALLSWLEDAIAQKELEASYAQMDEWIAEADAIGAGAYVAGNPIAEVKQAVQTMTTAELEKFLEKANEAKNYSVSMELYDLAAFLSDELEARQAQDAPTYINIGGERFAFVSALEADVKAVRVSGSTRNIEILADRSNAVQWSTNISSAALEERLASAGKTATGTTAATAVRAYKVLDDGTLEAKAAKVTVNADGTLTLSAMSDGNSTYIFVLEPNPYTDVDEDDWYYDAAMTMDQRLLMQGTTTTTFGGGASLTRSMIWTILARLDGVDTSVGETWWSVGREWAMANGISDGTNPETPITREQLAAMLYRYAIFKGYDVSIGEDTNILSWPDVFDVSEYAISAMQWACGAGIINGKDGKLVPTGSASRAEAAVMLSRFIED